MCSLSCPSCNATGFTSLSKLNKHRNGHEKPYECLAEGCHKRFAQRQALDRHTQSKHGDANNRAKYYHCTVDGCKYSSTGRRRKRFARADQAKEHIKDYGHYGPHSANDRPRRRGDWKPLFEERIITARFEEWTSDDTSARRTVQTCEYNSLDTKLWHKDDIGEIFLVEPAPGGGAGHECPVVGCYYHQPRPPENCNTTLFKTMKGLQEHHRRAHGTTPLAFSSTIAFGSQLHQDEELGSVSSLDSTAPSNDWGNITLNSNVETSQPWLPDLDLSFGAHNFEAVQCFNPGCIQYRRPLLGDLQAGVFVSDDFRLDDQGIRRSCQSCSQREPTTLQQPNLSLSLQLAGQSSDFHFTSLLSSPTTYATTSFPILNISEDNMQNASNATNNGTSLVHGENSLKLRKLTCTFPGCLKTFRRNYELQRHMMSVHSPTTIFCTICGRSFRRKDKLTEHIRHLHSISSESDSTKAKAMFSDLSIFSNCDWLSSSTFPSSKDAAPSDTLMEAGTKHYMEDINEWRPTSPKSLQIQAGTPESPVYVDESGSLSLSMNQDMCMVLEPQ